VAFILVGGVCVPIRLTFDLTFMKPFSGSRAARRHHVRARGPGNLNIVLTKWLAGPESTSYFGLAHRVGAVITMVAGAALTALYPGSAAREPARGRDATGSEPPADVIVLAYFAVFIALTLPSDEIIRRPFGPKFGPPGASWR